tara:strand:- start:14291 stop:15121 length:831 start_codon:yes stop_codon:yes gene_type:complete
MSRVIVTLIQQSQQILDAMGPKIKAEANKKIAEVKQKIPTKESVKQMMIDEISSKGPELICSIEVRNRIDSIYNKLKSKSVKLQFILDQSNEKLKKLQEQLAKIAGYLVIIESIILVLKTLVSTLQTVIISAQIAILVLKGPLADGDITVKLAELKAKSKSKIEEIKNSTKVFTKKIEKISIAASIPIGIIQLAIGTITFIKSLISTIIGLIESYYLKYILMCDVEGDSMEDEDYADAINDAPDEADITLIEDDLLPKTIERIRNANFQVIRYRIA